MSVAQGPSKPPAERIGLLYAIGVPIVVLVDVLLALLAGALRAAHAATQDIIETVTYAILSAGCSLVFCLAIVVGAAVLIARSGNRSVKPILLKIIFWSGLTWVPLFLVALILAASLRS